MAPSERYDVDMEEWQETVEVQPGGRIEIQLPELAGGERVRVLVRRENGAVDGDKERRPIFGFARGLIEMGEDFDAPLPDFDDYQ